MNERLVLWCAWLSGLASAVGILLLIVFYWFYLTTGDGLGFGEANDTATVIQYVLMLPIAVHLRRRLGTIDQGKATSAFFVGLTGFAGVIILQTLLIAGVIPFATQIGWVSLFFLIGMVWFILNKRIDPGGTIIPGGMALNVMAGLVFGYPLWSFAFAKRFRTA